MIIETTYQTIKEQANTYMRRGDLSGYLQSLLKLQHLRRELSLLKTAKV